MLNRCRFAIFAVGIAAFMSVVGSIATADSPTTTTQDASPGIDLPKIAGVTSPVPFQVKPGDTLSLDQVLTRVISQDPSIATATENIEAARALEGLNNSQRGITVSGSATDTYSSYRSTATTGSVSVSPSISSFSTPTITDSSSGSLYGSSASSTLNSGVTTTSTGSSTTTTTVSVGGVGGSSGSSSGGASSGSTLSGTGTGNAGTAGPNAIPSKSQASSISSSFSQLQTSAARSLMTKMAARAGQSQSNALQPDSASSGSSSTSPTGAFNNYGANLSATKIVDVYNVIGQAAGVFRKNTQFYRLEKQRLINEMALTVKKTYFAALQYQDNVATAEESLKDATKTLDDANTNYHGGASPYYDVLSGESQVASANESLIAAKNNLRVQLQALCSLMGIRTDTPFNIAKPDLPALPSDIDTDKLVKAAYADRPEMAQSDLNIEMAKTVTKLTGAALQPSLGVGAILSYVPGAENSANSHYDASLVAEVSMTLNDGGKTASEVKSAKITENKQYITKTQLVRNIDLEVRSAAASVVNAEQLAQSYKSSVGYSKELVSVADLRYRNGAGTLLELTNAESNLATAEYNLASAEYQLQTSYASYLRALGKK
jgi:outer membrane protein TolC